VIACALLFMDSSTSAIPSYILAAARNCSCERQKEISSLSTTALANGSLNPLPPRQIEPDLATL